MSTDLKWLQGKISENPREERNDLDRLLMGFIQALVEEQKGAVAHAASESEPEALRSGAV